MNQSMYIQNGVLGIISKIKLKLKNAISLRMHVFVSFLLVSIIALGILAIGIIYDNKNENYDAKIAVMQEYGGKIANKIMLTGYYSGVNQDIINAELRIIADIGYGRILIIDENLKVVYDTYQRDNGKTLISEQFLKTMKGSGGGSIYRLNRYIELIIPVYNADTKITQGLVLIDFALEDEYKLIRTMELNILIMVLAICVLILIFAFAYSNWISAPLKDIVKYMGNISEGYMEEDMKIDGYKEVRLISKAHNEMLSHVRRLESSRQEFVSNVSHELKTPMTSIKVLADSLIQQDAPVELYREFMADINDEIERENKIINDLLSLVKLDKNTGDLNISLISINDLLEIIMKRLKPIAQLRNIELVFESFRPVSAEVDEVKISLAVSNLIENAIKYNMEDGWVRVSINADHKYFYIKVSDSGIGISDECQKRIFERFYRVDRARSRQTGGTGLGLSITKSVVMMHNGAIKVTSRENEGSTFTMRLPLNYSL